MTSARIAPRFGWRGLISLLALLSIPSFASGAELYIGVAPGGTSGPYDAGTLIRASDASATGVEIGDAYPSENLTGYGGLAFDSSGNLWAVMGKDDSDIVGSEYGTLASTLVRIDPATGALLQTVAAVKDSSDQALGITDLAIQPGSNTLFGINTTTDIGPQPCELCLYTINSSTGVATLIGLPTYGSTRISLDTLAFAPDGTLYGTGQPFFQSTRQLYTINPATGAILTAETIVRDPNDPYSTTSSATTYGLAARPGDGTLFGTLCCSEEIVYHDNATHLWRFLGTTGLTSNYAYADLAFAPVVATPLPAAVWLFGSGLAGLAAFGRRRRRA